MTGGANRGAGLISTLSQAVEFISGFLVTLHF
jgi:hypothetical protein